MKFILIFYFLPPPTLSTHPTQLLARLNNRPDLTNIDPFIFESASETSNRFIELYGTEGVGKTELAYSIIARIILPSSSNSGVPLPGLSAKVVYVDTDSKFSILRLAVVLEKTILHTKSKAVDNHKMSANSDDDLIAKDVCNKNMEDLLSLKHGTSDVISNVGNSSGNSDTGRNISEKQTDSSSSSRSLLQPKNKNCGSTGKDYENIGTDDSSNMNDSSHSSTLSPQVIENIVKDSLNRIQILRPSSSQQLLASLISLERVLSEDSLYAILIVDSISSFYWIDRLASPTSFQHVDTRNALVAKMLKKFTSELGLTCLVTKQAFFGRKKCQNDKSSFHLDQRNNSLKSKNATRDEIESDILSSYNEYLGKIWSNMPLKRIILTDSQIEDNTSAFIRKSSNKRQKSIVKAIQAYCLSSETMIQYVFRNDLLVKLL